MFRLFIALNFLLLNLFACKGGYNSCILKVNDSKSIANQALQIPLKKNQKLVFSSSQPNAKIIKHDPFLNLYLIKDRKPFKHPFIINKNPALGIASINKKIAIEGKIAKQQVGLNSFATFSEALFTPALVLNSCCALEGLVTPRGIIEKEYLQRFIESKSVGYGDIGIRVYDKNDKIIVTRVNPFVDNNPFKKDDIIISMDGLKIKKSAIFMRNILFAKQGSSHKIKIQRGLKKTTCIVKIDKRYGGGYISDTFLEHIGIYLSKNLTITRLSDKYKNYGIKVGDMLMQVNSKAVLNYDDIAKYVAEFKKPATILIQRDGFQFFVNIK